MANWATVQRVGDPSSKDWQAKMLKEISASNGQKWRVFGPAAESFQGLFRDLEAAGYNPQSSGGFNYRTIRGSDKLSQHAFGNSIDVNAATNPMLKGKLQTDMPPNISEIAARNNLIWGGDWKNRPDPMHFEWKGGDVSEALKAAGITPGVMATGAPNFNMGGPVGTSAPALPTAAAATMAPTNVTPEAPKGLFEGLAENKDVIGGLDQIGKAFGAGQKQEQEQMVPLSNYSSEQAARAQSAQALMTQLLQKNRMGGMPRGLLG